MDARVILIVVVALLGGGYLVYGRFVARLVGVDPSRPTPAHTKYDGVDYVPAPQWQVLFGHHFSSICAAGPIVGPALAVAYWGWAPSVVWIVLGGVLMGALLYCAAAFVPMFTQGVLGGTAVDAGMTLAPMSIGWPIASTTAGWLLMRFGYRPFIILGAAFGLLGCLLLYAAVCFCDSLVEVLLATSQMFFPNRAALHLERRFG